MEIAIFAVSVIAVVIMVLCLVFTVSLRRRNNDLEEQIYELKDELAEVMREDRRSNADIQAKTMESFGAVIMQSQSQTSQVQDKRLAELSESITRSQDTLQKGVMASLMQMEERINGFSQQNEQQLENIRTSVEKRLSSIQEDNNKKLEAMRETVDEKLQKTINDRLSQSFAIVSERLEQVYKGLGEMQTLAANVGDLKKVMSNVKTRGVLGEVQLGAILEQVLAPSQYVHNIITNKKTQNSVEYAIILPGDSDTSVYLPIDAKFPADMYSRLVDAYDSGNPALIEECYAALEKRIKQSAKDIHDKYIDPPYTTDFGIMFLPFEGLYAEVVRHDLVEQLARDYKINIAGPTTMAALLNSLQMGFKTLALQKHSSEVWNVLGGVKTEFDKFGTVLSSAQKKLEAANDEIDKLVGVRTRAIQKKLKDVSTLSPQDLPQIFEEE